MNTIYLITHGSLPWTETSIYPERTKPYIRCISGSDQDLCMDTVRSYIDGKESVSSEFLISTSVLLSGITNAECRSSTGAYFRANDGGAADTGKKLNNCKVYALIDGASWGVFHISSWAKQRGIEKVILVCCRPQTV